MKVEIEIVTCEEQEKALIKTTKITDSITSAKKLLEGDSGGIFVTKEDKTYLLEYGKIYYIESVDNKCFVYTKDDCFATKYKLYELEVMLDYRFFRCSKSMICNVRKIRSVKTEYNAKMTATLLNDEIVIINRSYVKDLKKRLGM